MTRIVYVDNQYLPESEAKVSVFDRGFLMADGVYEVTSVIEGKMIDFDSHVKRLWRSLEELDIKAPCSECDLFEIHKELISVNNIIDGVVYLQVTRGNPGDRSFLFPSADIAPTVVAFTQNVPDIISPPAAKTGISVVSIPDLRWGRRDIKTVQLLYPSMGKMMAKKAGADDSWFVDDHGSVTEGTSNNAYIIKGNKIITRQLGNDILHGITRAAILRFAAEAQFEIEERAFTIAEAQAADEAFATAATIFAMSVVKIDDVPVGTGQPGPIVARLREIYIEETRKVAK